MLMWPELQRDSSLFRDPGPPAPLWLLSTVADPLLLSAASFASLCLPSSQLKLVRTEGKAWEVLNRGDAHEEAALTSTRPRSRGNNLLETVLNRRIVTDIYIFHCFN